MAGVNLRVICGPTAAGKSTLALHLAQRFHGAIISADSRQIYRGFDIGTAKPTAAERDAVPHLGIDVADPTERYSAARWADEGKAWIALTNQRSKHALIVGGTGLYIRALVNPLFDAPEMDAVRRSDLERELRSYSLAELRRWCSELDPDRAHLGRTQLLRAIETALLSGERISTLHDRDAYRKIGQRRELTARYLVVDPGERLASLIEARVDAMVKSGWTDEVARLDKSIPDDAPAWKASGYRIMRSYVRGEIDLSSARERVIIETRQYAKRQRTWFRHQLAGASVTRINPDEPGVEAVVHEWWERAE